MDFPECEQFTGRKRAICRGEAGLPLEGPHSTNAYRLRWGVVSNAKPGNNSAPSQRNYREEKLGRFPGTNLAILLKKCGITVKEGCDCEEWIIKMNDWGVQGCYENRQEIIDRMAEQSKQLSVAKIVWVGVLAMWNGMRPTIGELVDEALFAARNASK